MAPMAAENVCAFVKLRFVNWVPVLSRRFMTGPYRYILRLNRDLDIEVTAGSSGVAYRQNSERGVYVWQLARPDDRGGPTGICEVVVDGGDRTSAVY